MIEIEREKELEKEVDLSVVTAERQISTMESKCQELDAEVSQYQLNINNVQRGKLELFSLSQCLTSIRERKGAWYFAVSSGEHPTGTRSVSTTAVLYN